MAELFVSSVQDNWFQWILNFGIKFKVLVFIINSTK